MRLVLAMALAAFGYFYVTHHAISLDFNGGPMDGTVWDVRVKPDSWLSFSHKDTLVFDSGHLMAVKYMSAGFPSGAYSAAGRQGSYSWQASSNDGKNGTLEWNGRIQDDYIEGSIIHHEPGGRVRQLRFKGNRKLS